MKKLIILSLVAMTMGSAAIAAPRFESRRAQAVERSHQFKLPQPGAIWRPASQTEYEFFVETGKWVEIATVYFEYDSRGNCVRESFTESGVESVTTIEYNDDNLPTFKLSQNNEGEGWKNESKTSYEYDPVVRDYYTLRMGYTWLMDKWTENFRCESNVITRDEAGRITEIIKAVPLYGEMLPSTRMVWKYDDATGRANEYRYYCNYGEDVNWVLYNDVHYQDLEWEETDGQLVEQAIQDYVVAPNRLKSAKVYYEDQFDGYIIMDYTDNGYSVSETTEVATEVGIKTTVETVPYAENPAWSATVTTYGEYFDEKGLFTSEPVYQQIATVVSDEHGNIRVERVVQVTEGVSELMNENHYDYTYDDKGCPTELLVSYFDFDANEFVGQMRIVYHDYIDAGVDSPIGDSATTAEYYNLQGIRVASPTPGVYIRRQGNTTQKVIVK